MEESWEALVQEHLIATGLFTGIALLTGTAGECVYSHGQLCQDPNTTTACHQDWRPFTIMFADETSGEKGLDLQLDGKMTKFIVFKKTRSSVYATSEGKLHTLVAISLPQAILLCVSKAPTPTSSAVTAAEAFRSILK